MTLSDYRLALIVGYVLLFGWKAHRGALDDWPEYLLGYFVLLAAGHAFAVAHGRWQVRRAVRALRSLDPAHQAAAVERIWVVSERRFYAERLREEGTVGREGAVESFPFGRSDRRETTVLFWAVAVCVLLVFARLSVTPALPQAAAWALWAVCLVLLGVLARTRLWSRHLTTVLEVSPFGIAEVDEEGARRSLRWDQALVLRNRRRRRRLELSAAGSPACIALDYERVGFERLVQLVVDYGGFRDAAAALSASPRAGERSAGDCR